MPIEFTTRRWAGVQ